MRDLLTSRTRTSLGALIQYSVPVTKVEHFTWGKLATYESKGVEPRVDGGLYTFGPYSRYKVTDDVVTANFKARIAAGEIIMNDYRTCSLNVYETEGSYTIESNPWAPANPADYYPDQQQLLAELLSRYSRTTWTGYLRSLVDCAVYPGTYQRFAEEPMQGLVNRSISRVYANLSNAEMLGAVTLMEGEKTVQMLTKTIGRAVSLIQRERSVLRMLKKTATNTGTMKAYYAILRCRSIRDLKRMKRTIPKQLAKGLNLWLEVRYGWMPLVYEVQDAITATKSLGRPSRMRVTASLDDFRELPITTTTKVLDISRKVNIKITSEGSVKSRATSGLLIETRYDTPPAMEVYGSGEALLSAWELVPYSFVVDWFMNTADYVASWQPRLNISVLSGWTTVESTVCTEKYAHTPWSELSDVSVAADGLRLSCVYHERRRYADLPRPWMPYSNVRLSWVKGVDLLALAKNMYSTAVWRLRV